VTVPYQESADQAAAQTTAGNSLSAVAGGVGRLLTRMLWLAGVATVVAAALLLVALVLGPRVLPYRTYTILTGSMQPTLPVGSQVVLEPVKSDQLKAGDVIAFRKPGAKGMIVTHRILRVEHRSTGDVFVTKGDANGAPDPWRVRATGTGWRSVLDVPFVGYGVEVLQRPVFRILLLTLVAAVLGLVSLRRIWTRPAPDHA
jgi:signal peptidase I